MNEAVGAIVESGRGQLVRENKTFLAIHLEINRTVFIKTTKAR